MIQDDVVLKSVNGLDIIKYVLGCCHLTLQWHLAKIDPKNPNEEEMDTLWERLCSFLKICQEKLLSISELEEEVNDNVEVLI